MKVIVAFLMIVVGLVAAAEAKSVAAGRFSLNGRIVAEPGQIDWADLYNGTATVYSHSFIQDYFVNPMPGKQREPTSWHQGSKDTDDIPDWTWTPSLNSNDKGNILDAYAAIVEENDGTGRVTLYFGLDREAQNGAATVGFWFLQDSNFGLGDAVNNIAWKFNGKHVDGDLLIVADFPGQGTGDPANIKLLMWQGGVMKNLLFISQNATCDPKNDSQVICAITNDFEDIYTPWYYNGKFLDGNTIPARNFFEGGLVVNELVNLAGFSAMPCYSSFLAETRQSNSINAALEDFATGGLGTCGASFDANCLGGRQVVLDLNSTYTIPPFEWDYNVTLTNNGYNNITNVKIKLNDAVLYDVGTLYSQQTFFKNGTIKTNTSSVDFVFTATGDAYVPLSMVDSTNPCSSPVPEKGLTPGEKAAIAVGSIVGAAIAGAGAAGIIAAGYLLFKSMNAAPAPEILSTEMVDQGSDPTGVNALFEDNVSEATNPMFSAPQNV